MGGANTPLVAHCNQGSCGSVMLSNVVIHATDVRCFGNATTCFSGGSHDLVLTNFECDGNGWHPDSLANTYQSSACIKLHHGSLTVTDSYFHDNTWDAIWCDTLPSAASIDIRDSRFSHNGRAGFTWEVSGDSAPGDHALLQGNTFLTTAGTPTPRTAPEATPASSSPTPPTSRSPATPSKATSPSTSPAPAPYSCTTAHATHNQCTTSRSTTTPSTTTGSRPTPRAAEPHHQRHPRATQRTPVAVETSGWSCSSFEGSPVATATAIRIVRCSRILLSRLRRPRLRGSRARRRHRESGSAISAAPSSSVSSDSIAVTHGDQHPQVRDWRPIPFGRADRGRRPRRSFAVAGCRTRFVLSALEALEPPVRVTARRERSRRATSRRSATAPSRWGTTGKGRVLKCTVPARFGELVAKLEVGKRVAMRCRGAEGASRSTRSVLQIALDAIETTDAAAPPSPAPDTVGAGTRHRHRRTRHPRSLPRRRPQAPHPHHHRHRHPHQRALPRCPPQRRSLLRPHRSRTAACRPHPIAAPARRLSRPATRPRRVCGCARFRRGPI